MIIYHDGRDWAIEKREDRYWFLPLDANEWRVGLPPGITVDDLDMLFAADGRSIPVNNALSE